MDALITAIAGIVERAIQLFAIYGWQFMALAASPLVGFAAGQKFKIQCDPKASPIRIANVNAGATMCTTTVCWWRATGAPLDAVILGIIYFFAWPLLIAVIFAASARWAPGFYALLRGRKRTTDVPATGDDNRTVFAVWGSDDKTKPES